jgi:glycosyltransferase involved in cell wall biosynthesis
MFNLSIITINYNNADGLLATIKSVANQSVKEFEFVVIDGGSSDKSANVISQNKQYINYFCSEKDKGIYDAQNKGIEKTLGKYLLFLNSGDTFYSNTVIEKFYNHIKEIQEPAIIYGNTNLVGLDKIQKVKQQPKQLSLDFWYKETVNHQSTFISRDLFSKYGNYNTAYKICADFDFFLKVYVNNPNAYHYYNETIANYTLDGFSSNPHNFSLFISEHDAILKKQLTEKQYTQIKRTYIKMLSYKEQVLQYIRDRKVLKYLFDKIHNVYAGLKN